MFVDGGLNRYWRNKEMYVPDRTGFLTSYNLELHCFLVFWLRSNVKMENWHIFTKEVVFKITLLTVLIVIKGGVQKLPTYLWLYP